MEVLQTRSAAGTAAINLGGNQFTNTVIGNAGSNVINGSLGHDKLFGGGGNDHFVFSNLLSTAANLDRILDYNVAADTIRLKAGIFPGVATGPLAAAAFRIGAAPADANDQSSTTTARSTATAMATWPAAFASSPYRQAGAQQHGHPVGVRPEWSTAASASLMPQLLGEELG